MRGLAKFILFLALLTGIYYIRDAIIRVSVRSDSLATVTEMAGNISNGWNRAWLDRSADSNIAAQVSAMGNPHALDFKYYAQLGGRTSDVTCSLTDYTRYKDETQNYLAANYDCEAQFEHGPAHILINIARKKDTAPFLILYFDVISPNLKP